MGSNRSTPRQDKKKSKKQKAPKNQKASTNKVPFHWEKCTDMLDRNRLDNMRSHCFSKKHWGILCFYCPYAFINADGDWEKCMYHCAGKSDINKHMDEKHFSKPPNRKEKKRMV